MDAGAGNFPFVETQVRIAAVKPSDAVMRIVAGLNTLVAACTEIHIDQQKVVGRHQFGCISFRWICRRWTLQPGTLILPVQFSLQLAFQERELTGQTSDHFAMQNHHINLRHGCCGCRMTLVVPFSRTGQAEVSVLSKVIQQDFLAGARCLLHDSDSTA